jgi:hypothetical protein
MGISLDAQRYPAANVLASTQASGQGQDRLPGTEDGHWFS